MLFRSFVHLKETAFFLFIILSFTFLIVGCGDNKEDNNMEDIQKVERSIDSTIIRSKDVDVASIDNNGDEKVYQCPMDWEVISDESGGCPICKMDLEEFTVEEAQKNLIEYP